MVQCAVALEAGDLLLGRYRLVEPFGQGGSSTVYLATDEPTGRRAVIKQLRGDAPELVDDFRAEFGLLSRLTHPHLTRVLDFGRELIRGTPVYYYAADHVEGSTLEAHAMRARGRDLVRPLLDALEGLSLLHALGVRHGDVKPSNVLVRADGSGVLIDLGCASRFGPVERLSGSEGYLAPELLSDGSGDARSDLFSVGVTLRETYRRAGERPSSRVERLIERLSARDRLSRPGEVAEVLEFFGREALSRKTLVLPATLMGREGERRLFDAWLQRFLERRASLPVLAISGSSGMGVTRLTRELVWDAELRARVLRAHASEPGAVSRLLALATGEMDLEHQGTIAVARALSSISEPLLLVVEDHDDLDAGQRQLLASMARLLDESSRVALVISGHAPLSDVACERLDLTPLSSAALGEWAGKTLSATQLEELERVTGGRPAAVERWLAERLRGSAGKEPRVTSGKKTLALSRLGETSRTALALLSALGGELDPKTLDLTFDDFSELFEQGLVERDGARVRLVHGMDDSDLASALGAREVERAHRAVARRLMNGDAAARARALGHLVAGGELGAAEELLLAREAEWAGVADETARSALVLVRASRKPSVLAAVAELAVRAGAPRDAVRAAARLGRALSERRDGSRETRKAYELRGVLACADALTRLGRGGRAERLLARALEREPPAASAVKLRDRLARARLQRGDYAGAESSARRALALSPSSTLEGLLRETLGIALGYLGRGAEAELELQTALLRLGETAAPRDRSRVLSHRAIVAFRAGRVEQAIADHRAALALAEQHRLDDLAAVGCLNLGTAEQQAGKLGPALASYERGLILARATGRESTELTLLYNLANLYAEIGAFERAQRLLDQLEPRANRARLAQFERAIALLRAEIELARGDAGGAGARLDQLARSAEGTSEGREHFELELRRLDVDLELGQIRSARERVQRLTPAASKLEASDLELGLALATARLEVATGEAGARSRLERALAQARQEGHALLEARFESELALEAELAGDPARATERRTRAQRAWDRIAAGLPQALLDVFWQHPRRRRFGELTRSIPLAGPGARDSEALKRLLSLNRRLNSSLSAPRVLASALQAAIDLTGAERGFLLLRRGSGLEDGVTESPDGPRTIFFEDEEGAFGGGHGPSRTIVTRALEREEPVLTTDAEVDARFATGGSIHALRLKSVLCVPILSPSGTLGALYVDSRVQRGRFSAEERDLLLAFADQVAIAVANARLHGELERRTRELEEQKRAVERLSRGQAREIERLQKEVLLRQRHLESSYDYSQIVGRGAAMRSLLERLDRVVDSNASVLVLGESGTGKELVARAIHFNGPRKARAFVGINCAALPEALLESELFGHARGAFTGADRDKQGLMPAANEGTLFLDEIGEMPLSTQAKLLRVLQEREVRPLGATKSVPLDVRLICATHRDLAADVAEGRFREDLFYRVAVVTLRTPPLRERVEDLPELCHAILTRIGDETGRPVPELGADALRALAAYSFPGNVRELENILTRAFVLCSGSKLGALDLDLGKPAKARKRTTSRQEFEREERERILRALDSTRWNVSVVARTLGIPRNTLYRKLARYGLARTPS